MPGNGETGVIGLAELVATVVDEIVDGAHRAQLAQEEDCRELEAIAALDPAAVADQLVTRQAAEDWADALLERAGASDGWPRASAAFLRLAAQELQLSLDRRNDFDRFGLTEIGRGKVVAAARRRLAHEQIQAVRQVLRQGAPRVRITSGEVVVKLEMRARRTAAATGLPAAPAALKPLRVVGRVGGAAASNLRIEVSPVERKDATAAAVVGEIRLCFTT